MVRPPALALLGSDGEIIPGPPRHLIVLLDGTGITASNLKLGTRHSNIYKLNLALENHNDAYEAQVAFYIPGIGSSWTEEFPLAQALGFGLIGDVEQAYINICSNYYPGIGGSPGDHIYLFGFSRGAVVARLVAALISRFGLLHAHQLGRFADLWKVFMGAEEESALGTLLTAGVYKNVDIEFLGVFDTVIGKYVGSYADALKKHCIRDTLLPVRVKRALHLLALDETRPHFTSIAWTGLEPPVTEGTPPTFISALEQIWMPGCHSDVGGGYQEDFLSKVALLTMVERVSEHTKIKFDSEFLGTLEGEVASTLDDAVTPEITLNRETRLLWRVAETVKDGWRTLQKGEHFEHLHPICRLMANRLIRREGIKRLKAYRFPESGLPEASLELLLKRLTSRRNAGTAATAGRAEPADRSPSGATASAAPSPGFSS